ncbi:MAG: phosphate signaling complex protein PhoU [Synergistaceae bacterium]|nr:phosphate signaling complex protein PhoU [Synergistaceae bacterium]
MDRNKSVESYLYASDKKRIIELVTKMGSMVDSALKNALEAFIEANALLAEKIIAGDDEVDAMEGQVDLECLRSIAMRQPVREELRFIFAVLKTITDLERIGDESVNIARWVVELRKYPRAAVNPTLIDMWDISRAMLRDALNAFKSSDGNLSEELCRRDDQLDRMYEDVFGEFIDLMASYKTNDVNMVRAVAGQMWIARHLERIGDHVTNIAERVYFMDKGETLARN